jgi:crotonobetainyl-CoA:carnitine CoA-transferase CaiB-like acyl-CoA transferase
VITDREWLALREAMGNPEWALVPELDTAQGRVSQHDFLDKQLGAWTARFDDYALFHRLQAAGVPSAPVLEASRVFDDPHIQAREMYEAKDIQDDVGTFRYMAPFYNFPETPVRFFQAPVAFGEHNEYVYKELLGMSDDEFERLRADGHIREEFDESVP